MKFFYFVSMLVLVNSAAVNISENGLPGTAEVMLEFPAGGELIKVNQEAIHVMFDKPEIKDRKVVAVSIVGPFRKGKSFLLDYFLRYLYFTYDSVNMSGQKNQLDKAESWIGLPDEKLKGFSWKGGLKRHTTGIVFWSDIFLHDSDNGDKFAIILVDTQGLFDHDTPEAINGKIFSFTTLISSIQIYNLPNIIHENELQYLQFATEFAKFSLQDEGTGKPFEHLLFLLRDWVNSADFKNGFEGGRLYMEEEFLKIKNTQQENMKEMRKFINGSFDKISCFLLPHPGKGVQQADFNGSWSSLDEDFVAQLHSLIPGLLSPENLAAKKINGKDATVSEYLDSLEVYSKVFSSSEVPSAKSIYDTNVALHMDRLVKKSVDVYKEKVSNEIENIKNYMEFENLHLRCKEATIEFYKNERKMGTERHELLYQNMLIKEIDIHYAEFRKTASYVIQKKIAEDEKKAAEKERKAAEDAKLKMEQERKQWEAQREKERQRDKEMLETFQKNMKATIESQNKETKVEIVQERHKHFGINLGPFSLGF